MGKGSIARYYYGSVVYKDLRSGCSRSRTYGKSKVKVARKKILKWANLHLDTSKDRNIVQHLLWKLPVPFFAMRCVKVEKYLLVKEAPDSESLRTEWKNEAEVYQIESLSNATFLMLKKLLAVSTWQELKYGQEVFVDCDSNYGFN